MSAVAAASSAPLSAPGLGAEPAPRVQLSVPGMRCAGCIAGIERCLNAMPGVVRARVNLSLKRVEIETARPAEELIAALAQAGFEAHALGAKALSEPAHDPGQALLMRIGISGFALMNVMLLSVAVWSGATGATRDLFHLISAAIALPAVLYAAQPFVAQAWRALKATRLNMDVPISLAILLAALMSLYESLSGGAHAYFDAALSLTFFLLIGRYLEYRTRAAARSAARELAALEADHAERSTEAGVESVPIEALGIGDKVLVRRGVRVPVDGTLLSAEAHTDRAFLTGESDPATHPKGAALAAGEINLGAPFELQVTAIGDGTRLRAITRLVEQAENSRNRYTCLADRAARIYAPAVHLLALATFAGWMVLEGDLRHALNVAIAVLIITCPCALGLAVPAVSTAAISRLYRMGFLVKSGTALERLAEVDAVVFDKTGTLTRPGFSFDLDALAPEDLRVLRALAQASSHPLSRALDRHLEGVPPLPLSALEELPGKGVGARAGGADVALGQGDWLGAPSGGLWFKNAQNLIKLPWRETLAPGARQMTKALGAKGYALEILSGDTKEKTARLAQDLGIARFTAGISPEGKSAHVARRGEGGAHLCMIGDGLNDTVALAAAHASVAPGRALDAARSAADVVVLSQSLAQMPQLFQVARLSVRLARQNFGIALAYNAIAVPIAVLGHASPLAAALAMSLSSVTVLLNAMRAGRTP